MPSSSTVNVERLACPPTPPPRFDKFDVAVIHGWLACHPPSPPLPEPSPDPSPESSPDFSPARACSPSPSPAYRSRAIPLLSRPTPASPSRPKRRQPLQAIMSNNQRPKRNVREQSYKEPGPLIFDNPNEHENAKKGKMTSGQTRQGGGSPTKGSPSKKSGSLVNDYTEAITERMDNINPFANAPSLPHSSGIGGSGSSVPNNSGGSGNGSKRPSSPVRTTDDLRLLNKPVNQKQLANYRNYLPADALGLIRDVENLCLNIGILPSKLKELRPDMAIPSHMRCDTARDDFDLKVEVMAMEKVVDTAFGLKKCHEAHWSDSVVSPVLKEAFRAQLHMDSHYIPHVHPIIALLPSIGQYNSEKKMIDFVGCLIPQSVPDDTFSAWMREQPHYLRTVNQTSYPPISRTPTVISIEVKLDGDEDEALMQLGVWLSSWHNRVGLLQKNGPVISLPAIIVLRHEWTLYLAVDVGKSIDLVYIADIGNTRSLEGTYRLLAVLRRIGDWSLTTFNPWFKHTFLGLKEE